MSQSGDFLHFGG